MESVRIILEDVRAGRLVQARQLAERKLAADPNNGVLLSLKVHVAHAQKDRAAALAAAEPAVRECNKHTLRLFLIPILLEYKAGLLLNAAFERVNRLNPQDHEVTEAWIECALQLGSLESAQKALMAAMRSAPNPRSACYQACLVMALNFFEQNSIAVPTNERLSTAPARGKAGSPSKAGPGTALFPTLAQRMLAKFLPVESVQECYAGALVHRMSSPAALTQFLLENLQFVSGSLDLELLLLGALEEQQDFSKILERGAEVIKTIDSLQIWEILNRAAANLKLTESAVQIVYKRGAQTLNETLAELDWAYSDEKLVACWQRLQTKPGAFPLLNRHVTKGNIHLLEVGSDIGSAVNVAKFQNALGLSVDTPGLLNHYHEYVAHTKAIEKDYLFGTDALLIAVTSTLRSNEQFCRERALCMLEYAVEHDPSHFQVKLLLIAVYKSLGLHAPAAKLFKELDIKNIQLEGLAGLLTTRIATLAPQQSRQLMAVLDFHQREMPNFGFYSAYALSNDALTQFYGLFVLGRKLQYSLGTALLAAEKFQLARFVRGSTDISELLAVNPDQLVDNRDFTSGFNDGKGPIFAARLPSMSLGPVPDAVYAELMRNKELFVTRRRHALFSRDPAPETSFELQPCESLTPIEAWSLKVVEAISTGGSADIAVPDAPTSSLDWQFFHWAYTIIDTVKIAQLLKFDGIDGAALKKMVRTHVSKHQQASAAHEQQILKFLTSEKVLGSPAKLARVVKQQHLDLLKQVADELK